MDINLLSHHFRDKIRFFITPGIWAVIQCIWQLLKPHFHIFLHFYVIFTDAFYCPPGEHLHRKLIPHHSSICSMIHKHSSPQNENCVTFYSPSCCSIPVILSFLCRIAKMIFWRMYILLFFLLFFFFQTVKKSPRHFSKYGILFCIMQKKEMHTGLAWAWVNNIILIFG